MKISKKIEKLIPRYLRLPLLLSFIANIAVYCGTNLFRINPNNYDYTSNLDNVMPLIPGFIFIYIGCYIFWPMNYLMISRISKKKCFQLVTADLMGKMVGLLFFQFLPMTFIRAEAHVTGISTWLLNVIYLLDPPTNLFPSIHCLVSWYCFAAIRNEKGISKGYKVFSFIFVILVFMSTILVKQHILIDVLGGVLLAEITWQIATRTNISHIYMRIADRITNRGGLEINDNSEAT